MIKFRIKVMLAEQGMTQKQLSELTGVRLPTVSDLCLGKSKHISVQALEKFCDVLECQPGDLLKYIPEEIVDTQKK